MEPSWKVLKPFKIEAKATGLWTLVAEYVPGSRLLRLVVMNQNKQGETLPTLWSPSKGIECGADGTNVTPAKSGLLSSGAMYGALIGKIGGSSADIPDLSQPTTPYGSKRVFAVGSHCVISLSATDGGPLFLTMNDNPEGFLNHSGALYVLIEECGT